ncbi:hypothetical protein IWZ03DRAFT_39873 [Phyllosticta citriasiana]|uniref:Uncharacterized protein n=1 Tax=Phyllosticta citriasiana TaxID=595635 RepID=A0ABR1KH33_9PEZI
MLGKVICIAAGGHGARWLCVLASSGRSISLSVRCGTWHSFIHSFLSRAHARAKAKRHTNTGLGREGAGGGAALYRIQPHASICLVRSTWHKAGRSTIINKPRDRVAIDAIHLVCLHSLQFSKSTGQTSSIPGVGTRQPASHSFHQTTRPPAEPFRPPHLRRARAELVA